LEATFIFLGTVKFSEFLPNTEYFEIIFLEFILLFAFRSSILSIIKINAIILERNWQSNRRGSKRQPSKNKIPPQSKVADVIIKS
jgi:hypothetical protein